MRTLKATIPTLLFMIGSAESFGQVPAVQIGSDYCAMSFLHCGNDPVLCWARPVEFSPQLGQDHRSFKEWADFCTAERITNVLHNNAEYANSDPMTLAYRAIAAAYTPKSPDAQFLLLLYNNDVLAHNAIVYVVGGKQPIDEDPKTASNLPCLSG
jgi:hypothetical protein